MEPYYADDSVTLYHGDCRAVVHDAGLSADCIVADPPYGETSLPWDRWPNDWPTAVSDAAKSMWCFGSMRMFLTRRDDFLSWRLSHDVVWRKPEGGFSPPDRFRRNHELALHWYRGPWGEIYHEAQRQASHGPDKGTVHRATYEAKWNGERGAAQWVDDGTRRSQSVLEISHMRLRGIHPTEKPVGILDPLIRYACPPGGTVLDPFAGSGSTAVAARMGGRKAVLIEADERYCELIVKRLAQDVLPFAAVGDERDGAE